MHYVPAHCQGESSGRERRETAASSSCASAWCLTFFLFFRFPSFARLLRERFRAHVELARALVGAWKVAAHPVIRRGGEPESSLSLFASPHKSTTMSNSRACSLFSRPDGLVFGYKVLSRNLLSTKTPLVLVTGSVFSLSGWRMCGMGHERRKS